MSPIECAAGTKCSKLGNFQTTFVSPSSEPHKSNIKTPSGSLSGEDFSVIPILCLAAGMSQREIPCLHRVKGTGICNIKYLARNLKEMHSIMAVGQEGLVARTGGIAGNERE